VKRIGAFALVLALVGCGEEENEVSLEDTSEEFLTAEDFTMEPYRYCMQQNDRWLMNVITRIDRALPERFVPNSVHYEELHVSTGLTNELIDGDKKELLLRVTVDRFNGAKEPWFAVGPIDPDECEVGEMTMSQGVDRYAEFGVNAFTVPADR